MRSREEGVGRKEWGVKRINVMLNAAPTTIRRSDHGAPVLCYAMSCHMLRNGNAMVCEHILSSLQSVTQPGVFTTHL